jgi:hypothetical protein
MNKERARILKMVAKGKITVEEADSLLEALQDDSPAAPVSGESTGLKDLPKFMYVQVNSANEDNVNVKVPLSLIRAGMRLTSLIPPKAMDQVNSSLEEHGMSMDLNNLTKEDIEQMIEGLVEMEVKVDSKNGDKVRVYCA